MEHSHLGRCDVGGSVEPRGSTAAAQTAETVAAALAVLRDSISVDVHTHGGASGITSTAPPSDDLAKAMRAGSLAVACLADVPDAPILTRSEAGVLTVTQTPEPGALYKYHLERLDWVDEMVATHGLRRALPAADLEAAHNAGQPAIVGDVEGLDFLEKKLERLEEAHQRGVRHVQLVHYTPNDIGDFQTGAITHRGLTPFGAEVIEACHRLGFVCDVAHATEDTVKQAVKVATKPLLLSHTALAGSRAMGPTPLRGRQVSRDHVRAIAETGGSIGIWHFFSESRKVRRRAQRDGRRCRGRSRQHRHRPAGQTRPTTRSRADLALFFRFISKHSVHFDMNQLPDSAPMPLPGRQQRLRFLERLRLDPPLLGARHQHRRVENFRLRFFFQFSRERHVQYQLRIKSGCRF
jgi:membrane dipeptidase